MLTIPQIIDPSVPLPGLDDSCNVEVQRFGEAVARFRSRTTAGDHGAL